VRPAQAAIVRVTAAVFAAYGIAFVCAPVVVSLYVTGSAPGSPSGVIDMRATYGGMSVAVGLLLFVLASKPERVESGLLAVVLLMLGMAAGRLFGIVVDGDGNALMYAYLALEVGMAGLAGWSLARGDRAT